MKLVEIEIRRLPGIAAPFTLGPREIGSEVTLIHGPNAAGKSSVVRALRALLWPAGTRSREIDVRASFDVDGASVVVERHAEHVSWRTDGEPCAAPDLPPIHLATCYTISGDDLLGGGEAATHEAQETALASEIARQMAGGFDLSALRERLDSGARPGQSRDNDLRDARSVLSQAQAAHKSLDDERAMLGGLRERLQQVETAARSVGTLETALELHAARETIRAIEHDLRAFPAGMQELRGDELERLGALDRKLAEGRTILQRCEEESARARATLAETGLPDEGLAARTLEELRTRVTDLGRSESEVARVLREQQNASDALEDQRRALHPTATPSTDSAALAHADALLRRAEALSCERAEFDAELAMLDEASALGDGAAQAAGMQHLTAWLAAPDPSTRGGGAARGVLLVWILAASIALGAIVHPAGYALIVAAVLTDFLVRAGSARHADARRAHRDQFERLQLASPTDWTRTGVEQRVKDLLNERAAIERAHAAGARKDKLRRRVKDLDVRASDLERDRVELAAALGLELSTSDFSLTVVAHQVIAYQKGARELESRRALVAKARSEQERAVRALASSIEALGVSGGTDAATLAGALAALTERAQAHANARAALASAAAERKRASRVVADLERERSELLAAAGDERELARRLDSSVAWKKAQTALGVAQSSERSLRHKLAAAPERIESSREALEIELATARASLEERDGLIRQKQDIETRVREFEKQHGLEEALANVQAATDALRDRREEALDDAAALWLIERIEDEAQQTAQSPVFRRAAALFAKFTHHAFELHLTAGRAGTPPSFRALDTALGAKRALHELSSGTRAQLLLAARVAFAFESERGVALPLFLDEALANSDPQRFQQIAASLSLLARDEVRQVIYLTSDPLDVQRWREAVHDGDLAVVDLARVRSIEGAADADALLRPQPLAIPSPLGMSAEQYARALGVPAVDPYATIDSLHLHYVLFDEPDLLHRLLGFGFQTLGALRSFARSANSQIYVSSDAMSRIENWAAVYEATLHAWQIGRGRPFGRDALAAAGVSEKFIASLCEIGEEVGWNAKQLVARLRSRDDERLKGWRENKSEVVETTFSELGYLDVREPLTDDEVVARVLLMSATIVSTGGLDAERIAERATWILSLVAHTKRREVRAVPSSPSP